MKIITEIAQTGSISDAGFSMIIIALMLSFYKYAFKPFKEKADKSPSEETIKSLLYDLKTEETVNIEELSAQFDKMLSMIDEIGDISKGNFRETKELKKDIETMKSILNQFQGHMMYGRRGDDFGNRELK
jgi:SMC interacting uncharacterized protein involved in chromosome segregation